MRIKEIELSAAKGQPLPKHPTAPELCLYTTLRALYKSYHKQEISKETAQAEKRRVIGECERYEAEYIAWVAAAKCYQDNIRKAGTLLSEIEKAITVEAVALKACEAIGCMIDDEGFLKRYLNRVGGTK